MYLIMSPRVQRPELDSFTVMYGCVCRHQCPTVMTEEVHGAMDVDVIAVMQLIASDVVVEQTCSVIPEFRECRHRVNRISSVFSLADHEEHRQGTQRQRQTETP